jgi:hypothetical protein
MPVNPELRYWHDLVRAAEAELDAANTNSDLKLAAQRLMRARRRLLTLQTQEINPDHGRSPRRRPRPSSSGLTPHSRNPQNT